MWKLTYCDGWGQRGPRSYHNYFFTRKPTQQECVSLLNKKWATTRFNLDYFLPKNSGLLTISKVETEF